jgi:hypothetical protein
MFSAQFEEDFLAGMGVVPISAAQRARDAMEARKQQCYLAGLQWSSKHRRCMLNIAGLPTFEMPFNPNMTGFALGEFLGAVKTKAEKKIEKLGARAEKAKTTEQAEKLIAQADALVKKQAEKKAAQESTQTQQDVIAKWVECRRKQISGAKIRCSDRPPGAVDPAPETPAPTDGMGIYKTQKTCNQAGGLWSNKTKWCYDKPVVTPPTQTPSEDVKDKVDADAIGSTKKTCVAQGNIWEAKTKTCLKKLTPTPTTPVENIPGTGLATTQQACKKQGGIWDKKARQCLTALVPPTPVVDTTGGVGIATTQQACKKQGGIWDKKAKRCLSPNAPWTPQVVTCPEGTNWDGSRCLPQVVVPTPIGGAGSCPPGYHWQWDDLDYGDATMVPGASGTGRCVRDVRIAPDVTGCPTGYAWNGVQCVWTGSGGGGGGSWQPDVTDDGGDVGGSIYQQPIYQQPQSPYQPLQPSPWLDKGGGSVWDQSYTDEGVSPEGGIDAGQAPPAPPPATWDTGEEGGSSGPLTMSATAGNSECSASVKAQLPMEYSDSYGKMKVLAVVCGAAAGGSSGGGAPVPAQASIEQSEMTDLYS